MWKRLQTLIFIGLMMTGGGARASAVAADVAARTPAPTAHALPLVRDSRRSTDCWRSSSGSAIAAAILNDLARRRRNGRNRNVNVRDPASLARVLKRLP